MKEGPDSRYFNILLHEDWKIETLLLVRLLHGGIHRRNERTADQTGSIKQYMCEIHFWGGMPISHPTGGAWVGSVRAPADYILQPHYYTKSDVWGCHKKGHTRSQCPEQGN